MAREGTGEVRPDGVERQVHDLRVETRTEFTQLRGEMRTEFTQLRREVQAEFTRLRGEMNEGFARVDERLDSIQRAMIYMMVSVTGGMLAGFSAILVLIATRL